MDQGHATPPEGEGGIGGILPHRQLEAWLAGRLMRYMEPKVETLVRSFLASDEGQAMVADVAADVMGDLFDPQGPGEGGLTERVLLAVVGRYLARPQFRAAVEALLRPPAGP
jgi:hypothetical protein